VIIFILTFYRTHILDNAAYAAKTLALHISLLWAFVPELGHSLNQPSWALSVFFICYALTPAISRFLNGQGKNSIWLLFLAVWIISVLFVICFEELPKVFSGINYFSGMLLGRLFLYNAIPLPKKSVLNDLFLLLAAILLCINVCWFKKISPAFSYHIISPVFYSALLLFFANNKGIAVKILSVSWIRAVGKASFYTYLLHCVVIGFLHLYLDKVTSWKHNIFDNPLATLIIMILLYGSCTIYSQVTSPSAPSLAKSP
jgi:peptidoglycan/LPS O-acetylase OafA/YrhL